MGLVDGALTLADGRFLSWSYDNTLRLWATDGTLLRAFEGHTKEVIGVLALANGGFLSWSYDKTLRLWAADGTPLRILDKLTFVISALELADCRFLSWGRRPNGYMRVDNTLQLWTADGTLLHTLTGHTDIVLGALELADGRFLSWSVDGALRLWSIDGTPYAVFYGEASIRCCALSRNQQVVVAGDESGRVMFLRLPE
jgi:WD40 repeat protein